MTSDHYKNMPRDEVQIQSFRHKTSESEPRAAMAPKLENGEGHTAHCLFVPFPYQGHINPMVQFAKRLAHKHIRITLALTRFLLKSTNGFSAGGGGSVSIRDISDGFDDGGRAQAKSAEEYCSRFEQVGRETLSELLHDLAGSGCPVDCVVYDPFIPWVLDVVVGLGLSGAAFFTQSCAVDSIYWRVLKGELKVPLSDGEVLAAAAGLPPMRPEELPSFIYDRGSYPGTFQLVLNQLRNVDKADWIFINTFEELEKEVLKWMGNLLRVKAIGPTIPSMYLDKRLRDDKDYGLSMFKPETDDCMTWLDQRQPKSVIYVAFGSLAKLTPEQTEELARALAACGKHFLWVVRSSEASKLPTDFSDATLQRGLIVSWCPQLDVLAHEAVGCFITHCGWNSTLEALSLGVPIVAMPQWTDQSTNTKFVADVWRVGVRARADETGLVRRGEIIHCVERVMEGGEGDEISLNSDKWRRIARATVDEGGSSDHNIEEFVRALSLKH